MASKFNRVSTTDGALLFFFFLAAVTMFHAYGFMLTVRNGLRNSCMRVWKAIPWQFALPFTLFLIFVAICAIIFAVLHSFKHILF